MLTLYRSPQLSAHWVAYSDRLGWVMFPAKPNGWQERKPYRGETARLMRLPPRLGFNTGFPHPAATPAGELQELIFAEVSPQVRRRVA